MGNWQLEVAKMAVYVFMPVAAFYVYHQVDYFEDELTRFARRHHTRETVQANKTIKEAIELNRQHRENMYKEELKRLEKQFETSPSSSSQ